MLESNLKSEFENSFSFWKNLSMMVLFFTIAPVTLGISLFTLYFFEKEDQISIVRASNGSAKVYASLPNNFPSVSASIETADARPQIIRNYLLKYKSPLVGLEEYIVKKSDEYGIDFRLIVAISQQESNLCKIIPPDTYNCWGWGIHSRGTLGFSSYEEGINTVLRGLKNEYIDKGYTTPDTIWKKYTPSSPDGAWAKGVNQFMNDMQ